MTYYKSLILIFLICKYLTSSYLMLCHLFLLKNIYEIKEACHTSPYDTSSFSIKNKSKNSRKSTHVMSPFSIELQLIYVNYLDMHIYHIITQSQHITSAPNQHSRGLIGRFTLNPLSFNLTHSQLSQFYILIHMFYPN
jgi:hypothetical protein